MRDDLGLSVVIPVRDEVDSLRPLHRELDAAPANRGKVFANVLELTDRTLLLECCRSLEEGTRVEVSYAGPNLQIVTTAAGLVDAPAEPFDISLLV